VSGTGADRRLAETLRPVDHRGGGLVWITRRFGFLVAVLAAVSAPGAAGPTVDLGGGGDLTLGAEERRQIERGLRELTGRLGTLRRAEGRGPEGEVVRTGFFDEKRASQRPGMSERGSTGDLRRPSALPPVTPTVSEDDGASLPASWT
jgi:hypothetical protein